MLPEIPNQTAYNLDRRDELGREVQVRNWPGRVETDRFGRMVMLRYEEYDHGFQMASISAEMKRLLSDGSLSFACPISTSDGVKVADVSCVSKKRLLKIGGRTALSAAPEICVEVISPANTRGEIEEKRRLYFEAGAKEVWICDKKGRMIFFLKDAPSLAAKLSKLCLQMPKNIV